MNEKQFLEMDDRERDAFIAEHIMGNEWHSLQPYSADYNAMMRVADSAMEIDDIHTFDLIGMSYGDRNVWRAVFHGDYHYHSGWLNDRKLAVYLAAGRAKGKIE